MNTIRSRWLFVDSCFSIQPQVDRSNVKYSSKPLILSFILPIIDCLLKFLQFFSLHYFPSFFNRREATSTYASRNQEKGLTIAFEFHDLRWLRRYATLRRKFPSMTYLEDLMLWHKARTRVHLSQMLQKPPIRCVFFARYFPCFCSSSGTVEERFCKTWPIHSRRSFFFPGPNERLD